MTATKINRAVRSKAGRVKVRDKIQIRGRETESSRVATGRIKGAGPRVRVRAVVKADRAVNRVAIRVIRDRNKVVREVRANSTNASWGARCGPTRLPLRTSKALKAILSSLDAP
jgi:hypothetical protein